MRHLLCVVFCTFSLFSSLVQAKTSDPTAVNDSTTASLLLGQHKLHHHLIGKVPAGQLKIENHQGIYSLNGSQTGPALKNKAKPDSFKIQGQITEINTNHFKFTGTIETRLKIDGKACKKTGLFYFAYSKKNNLKQNWRLLQNQHTCSNKTAIITLELENKSTSHARPILNNMQQKWGIGIITYNSRIEPQQFKVIFPADGKTSLYDAPKGSKVADLNINLYGEKFSPVGLTRHQIRYQSHAFRDLLIKRNNTVAKINVHPKDLFKYKSNIYAIKVLGIKDGYAQILPNTMRHKAWVSLKDLAKQGYQFSSWRDFLLLQQALNFEPSFRHGLNLRSDPVVKENKLTTMRGHKYYIRLTGQTSGKWMEVSVTKLSPQCRPLKQQWKGWIKALDDKGFPNIQLRSRYKCH